MKSPSRAGALARTASTGSDGRTTSSRRMFSSSIVWAVGGMSSVGSVGQDRVLVEDVVQLALEPGQLVVGQAEPGEMGDVLDVGAGQGGHGPMIADGPATIGWCNADHPADDRGRRRADRRRVPAQRLGRSPASTSSS